MEFQRCQKNSISKIDRTVLGKEMERRDIESVGDVQYIHSCAKMEGTVVTKTFDTEDVLVRRWHANETIIKYVNPISKVFQINYTVAEGNAFYPNLLYLTNGSWITYGSKIELERVVPGRYGSGSRAGLRPHEIVGLMGNWLFTLDDTFQTIKREPWNIDEQH